MTTRVEEMLERIAKALEDLVELTLHPPGYQEMEEFIKLQKKHLEDHMNEGPEGPEGPESSKVDG